MFLPPGNSSKESIFYKKIEMYAAFSLCAFPIAYLLKDAYYLSASLSKTNKIAGVVNSPYFSSSRVDLNDGQLKGFLEGLPLLSLVAVIFVVLRRALVSFTSSLSVSLVYYLVFGIGFATYIHGPGVVYIILMVLCNYLIDKNLVGTRLFPIFTWIGNLAFLLITEYYHGYKFAWISQNLAFLDSYSYELQWHRVSNLCMLKVVSFMIDHHWKVSNKAVPTHEKHLNKCDECTESIQCLKYRMESHGRHFSCLSFMSYVFYPPLYLAGPTLTYNAWISQVIRPQETFSTSRLMTYLLRFLVVFAVLMWFIHNLFFPTIANNSKNRHILDKFGPYELIIASYFILKWIWLKFTVIWRFFRIWALLDGIESPENMGRCMSNNYCFEGFWRMWHRAFNQWLIRYLFIPLGGGKYKIFNIWVVFGFVALWHDLTLNLLAWGWGMCIFIMPEVLAKAYFASERMAGFRKTLVYSWMSACAGGVYICLMILANLVGFSFGLAGLRITLEGMMNFEGFLLLLKSLTVLTFGTHFMLLFREDEQRRGLKDKGY
jgi:D-alanyl-lipoteichoic acid acyltransferase DltB (MBOAT superfamily)